MPPTLHLSLVVVAVFSAFVSFHLFGVVNPRVDAPVESGAPSSFFEDARLPYSSLLEDAQLLDIVLVASVDGKFHALNRSTGHTLWSSLTSSGGSITLPPLVRTSHLDHDPDLTDYQETYIIEPQSGDIYVMATPSSPIERFPFTMAEIVEMSPFSFTADDDHRVFVGNKETSWLVVELETPTGVKAPVEGPWDPFEDLHIGEEKIDLDELDGSKPQMSKLEVLIGRTDYHVTIHSGASNKMQTLSFSTYGPNILYSALQGSYRRTKDEKYIQSLPNGEIISFKAHGESAQNSASNILWAYKFSSPIVAVFDILQSSSEPPENPFVLLQPRPPLSAILPELNHATPTVDLDSVYVGLIEGTDSLFAMSPDRFPLIVFGRGWQSRPKMAASPPEMVVASPPGQELPGEIDAVTRALKERERAMAQRDYGSEDDRCQDKTSLYTDRRCLVGIRPLEGSDGDGPEMRMKRLVDGVPGVPLPRVSAP